MKKVVNNMNLAIAAAVISGIICGLFVFPNGLVQYIDTIINLGLCALLFFVGIDIGRSKGVVEQIKQSGVRILLVPAMVAAGSITGSIAAGILLRLPVNEAGAIGAGFGWYSLSAIILSKYSTGVGAIAFITNVWREIMALIVIPFVAKYIGKLESIAPAGATAMDTTLPVISKATDGKTSVISFITGAVLSMLVPVLVPLIISL